MSDVAAQVWAALRTSPRLVATAVRDATRVQMAAATAVPVAVLVGVATVLIPNDVFSREVAPVAWNYPTLLVTAVLSGLLAATYVRTDSSSHNSETADPAGAPPSRTDGLGPIGVVFSWFAVGCPVCNKLAVLALGYSGALTWFAPLQPVLALAGIALLWTALAVRLNNQRSCRLPRHHRASAA
ncbi:hypothetical protein ACIGKQ_02855 [Gordonia sp. NPDC062954]|uniref:hypothetical protein n=1 Tax=Gordonia sp. NPDC062954 TaxID=3364003 RepID=UPI0037C69242